MISAQEWYYTRVNPETDNLSIKDIEDIQEDAIRSENLRLRKNLRDYIAQIRVEQLNSPATPKGFINLNSLLDNLPKIFK